MEITRNDRVFRVRVTRAVRRNANRNWKRGRRYGRDYIGIIAHLGYGFLVAVFSVVQLRVELESKQTRSVR